MEVKLLDELAPVSFVSSLASLRNFFHGNATHTVLPRTPFASSWTMHAQCLRPGVARGRHPSSGASGVA
jgi:hypothetical protein